MIFWHHQQRNCFRLRTVLLLVGSSTFCSGIKNYLETWAGILNPIKPPQCYPARFQTPSSKHEPWDSVEEATVATTWKTWLHLWVCFLLLWKACFRDCCWKMKKGNALGFASYRTHCFWCRWFKISRQLCWLSTWYEAGTSLASSETLWWSCFSGDKTGKVPSGISSAQWYESTVPSGMSPLWN